MSAGGSASAAPVPRPAAVAGLFYPGGGGALRALVDDLLVAADEGLPIPPELAGASLVGVFVPHAGLVYSGLVAAAAWRLLRTVAGADAAGADVAAAGRAAAAVDAGGAAAAVDAGGAAAAIDAGGAAAAVDAGGAAAAAGAVADASTHGAAAGAAGAGADNRNAGAPTIVLLGTNHGAAWLTGVGAWDGGPWRTPLGDVAVDGGLIADVIGLGPPFVADAACHQGEHSIEVQAPFPQVVAPRARIVPLAVGTGTGERAIEAGERLGRLLAERRAAGDPVVLAISTDMAHYPRAAVAERITATLLPRLLELDPAGLAEAEARVRWEEPGASCGMCGIEPAVLGLAALRAMGVEQGVALASATSADAGGDPGRTVGYLAVGFPGR
jgi:AmmeMemoRadiSam system protein B